MSQKVVYVRRPITPRYDPDPDPDPIGVVAIAICVIGVCLGASTVVSPNLWTNLMIMLKPELKELEEERLQAQKDTVNAIMVMLAIVAIMVLAYIWWRWNMQKKEAQKRIRLNTKRIRMLRPR